MVMPATYAPVYSEPSASIAPYGPTDPATQPSPCPSRARITDRSISASALRQLTPRATNPSRDAW
jgi:hypothetical protein